MKKWLALSFIVLLAGACANRWREGEVARSVPEIEGYVESVLNGTEGQGNTGMLAQAREIRNDPNSFLYYTEAPSDLGPIYAVTPFYTFEFMSQQVFTQEVNLIKVSYIDKPLGDGSHHGVLIFDIQKVDGTKIVEVFVNDASSGLSPGFVDEGVFEISLKGSNGNVVTLISDDTTSDDELADVIQFNVVGFDSQGVDIHYGKLSTMIGYY
ncbi:MAG: hypothetical protein ABL958_18925 [Bdellovibrionia bacterium]